ncbi:MAG: crosslink repair DNA glycosylase YcaQ family protein [Dehalococcoidia bacterium]|nr:crosslink repair DNA glycosylase YcaQ family protein [Dehalococcoidia bacterium]
MMSFPLEQVNLFCLSKQYLHPRSMGTDVTKVAGDVAGLSAGRAITPFLSLWARVNNFSPGVLMKALYQEKKLGKIKFVRGNIFILPVDMIEAAVVSTSGQPLNKNGTFFSRAAKSHEKGMNCIRGSRKVQETVDHKSRIINLLRNASLTIEQMKKELDITDNISEIVYELCDSHVLARGPTTRWYNNKHQYTTWENWFPEIGFQMVKKQARAMLVQSYIKSYGPVSIEDIAWWTGFAKDETPGILDDISGGIEEITIDCFEGKFLVTADDFKTLKETKYSSEPVVNFLPSQDNYMVAYRRRGRQYLRDIYPRIHDRAGNVMATILVNGHVAGAWDIVRGTLEYSIFERIENSINSKVEETAVNLSAFLRENLAQ